MNRAQGLDLVTGGGGFIGSHLVDRLLSDGRKVRVLDNFEVGRRANLAQHADDLALEVIEGDVSDPAVASRACQGAERIFHLAARADIVPSIQSPEVYFNANVAGTFAILEAARKHAANRFVYAASSSCYGVPDVYPTPEDAPIDCRYPYALTKWVSEQMVLHWANVYGLAAVSLRFFNVFGPRARTSGTYGAVFGVFLAQLLADQPLTVVGDGEQTRDFTFVTDVVEATLVAADSGRTGEVYNVGSGRSVSVNELVRHLGSPPTVKIPKRPGEPDCTWADTAKIERDLGWHARVPFSEGVKLMLDNIEYWRDAPVWTTDTIGRATEDWFKYLGDDRSSSQAAL